MIEFIFALVVIFLVARYFLIRPPKCDFCNDEFRFEDEPLIHYGDSVITGDPKMYCGHCVAWWVKQNDL